MKGLRINTMKSHFSHHRLKMLLSESVGARDKIAREGEVREERE
jgi:hypothetical protein